MGKKSQAAREREREASKRTPTFLLELPLQVSAGQAARLRAHLEAARQFYNAVLSEGLKRLRAMRADPAWQATRAIPRTQKQERSAAFQRLREQYGFSEYALHEAGKVLRVSWLAKHVDAVLAQTLTSRAYHALNRLCLGLAKRVRFRSHGRGLGNLENKRNDTGLRFVLQNPEEGNQGFLVWKDDHLPALIDWKDPVIKHGLDHRIKYARLVQRKASSTKARGADFQGYRYSVQLALEGAPYHKGKHKVGNDTIGADLGPSTIALVPREGEASLSVFCEELAPNAQAIRRLQRKMERQRRAANPGNYDEKGRIKKQGGKKLVWKSSKSYQKTRQRKAEKERKLAAHRKSLHGRKVHEIIAVGNTVILEKISYKAWQKQYGRSVGMRAPGMFLAHLKRTVASTGGTLVEVPTRSSKLSQFCHGCGAIVNYVDTFGSPPRKGLPPARASQVYHRCQGQGERAHPTPVHHLPGLDTCGLALATRTGGTRSRAAADGEQAGEREDSRLGEGLRGPLGRLQLAGTLPHPPRRWDTSQYQDQD